MHGCYYHGHGLHPGDIDCPMTKAVRKKAADNTLDGPGLDKFGALKEKRTNTAAITAYLRSLGYAVKVTLYRCTNMR